MKIKFYNLIFIPVPDKRRQPHNFEKIKERINESRVDSATMFFLLVQGDISTMLTFWKCNKNLRSDVLIFDH